MFFISKSSNKLNEELLKDLFLLENKLGIVLENCCTKSFLTKSFNRLIEIIVSTSSSLSKTVKSFLKKSDVSNLRFSIKSINPYKVYVIYVLAVLFFPQIIVRSFNSISVDLTFPILDILNRIIFNL